MVHLCTVANSRTASPNHFISLKTTPPCPAGSKAWRSSSRSVAYGLRKETFSPSARVFVAPLVALTAAAGAFFFCSQISSLKRPSFKSWSSLVGTSAISIQNTIVNLILSNNIGGRQSFISIWQGVWQHLMRWRGRSSKASMTSPSFTSNGESCTFFSDFHLLILLFRSSSYANRSTRYISAYHARLSGSQAVWVNRKYHSHRTLPPEIIVEVKRSII
jgi:hypothetical protein